MASKDEIKKKIAEVVQTGSYLLQLVSELKEMNGTEPVKRNLSKVKFEMRSKFNSKYKKTNYV